MTSAAAAPMAPRSAPILMMLAAASKMTTERRMCGLYRFLMLRARPWPVTLPIRPQAGTAPRPGVAGPVAEFRPRTQGAPENDDLRVSIRPGPPPVIEVRGEIDVCSSPQLRDQLLWVVR